MKRMWWGDEASKTNFSVLEQNCFLRFMNLNVSSIFKLFAGKKKIRIVLLGKVQNVGTIPLYLSI